MGRLFCIIGKSGSGKDTVFKKLLCEMPSYIKPVVTYTTRPKRDNETDGVEYHFITENKLSEFKKAGKIIELRQYDTVKGIWYYCTVDDGKIALDKGNFIVIATLEGLYGLKKRFGSAAVPLYIDVEDGERLLRALLRERMLSSPDYSELCRRFLADSEDFSQERLKKAGITVSFSNENLENCIENLKKYILSFDSKNE